MSLVTIGKISKPQGVRGELKIIPLTDDAERFVSLREVYVGDTLYRVVAARVAANGVFVTLEGVCDRNAAELLRNMPLQVSRRDAVRPAPDRCLIVDLIGCEVTDGTRAIGTVCDVLQHGAADVWVIRAGDRKAMIPAIRRLVLDVDVQARKVLLDRQAYEDLVVYED